jgi:hypothetical protein
MILQLMIKIYSKKRVIEEMVKWTKISRVLKKKRVL